jgi:hypothetical protein
MYRTLGNHILLVMHSRGCYFWVIIFILASLFSLTTNATELSPSASSINPSDHSVSFDTVLIKGMHVYKDTDLAYIFNPYQGTRIQDEAKFHADIVRAVNQHYLNDGYIFSMVSNCEIHDQVLHINILEGSINEVVVQKENENIKDVQYIREYSEYLTSLQPFNMKNAEKYFLLIKRLLGNDITLTPVFLSSENIDESNPKTVDLFISNYKKVKGSFEIDKNYNNYISADNSNTYNTDITHNSGYFSMGGLRTKINNPFNTPSNLNTYLRTSGDKKENIIFTSYTHQINQHGTQLKIAVGYDQFNFTKRQTKFFTASTGVSHPLLLTSKQQLELSASFDFYTLNKQYNRNVKIEDLSSSDVFKFASALEAYVMNILAPRLNNHSNVFKVVVGSDYRANFLGTNNNAILRIHAGRSNLKFPNNNSQNINSNFSKLTLEGKIEYVLPKDFSISLYIDTQYSNSKNLPIDEYFSVGQSPGGRGILPGKIIGKSGIQGALEFSHLDRINHPLLFAINEYIYIDSAKVSKVISPSSSKNVSSVGIGIDAYLVDNLIVNLELNKPIKAPKVNNSKLDSNANNKEVKLFAGLKYMFSF